MHVYPGLAYNLKKGYNNFKDDYRKEFLNITYQHQDKILFMAVAHNHRA